MKTLRKIKAWLSWHWPVIMTRRKLFIMLNNFDNEMSELDKTLTWAAINPVILSLKELRKNTWDKERVDIAINWLEENFKDEDR